MNDIFEEQHIKVYIKTDGNGNVIDVNSEIFISDLTGWTKIDEGFGDKYAHAQSHYFDEPIINREGAYNYKYQNSTIVKA